MVRLVEGWEYESSGYELGDLAWFMPPYSDEWVQGEIVRVYNTRTVYHILYAGSRYEVTSGELHRTCPE